IVVASDSRLSGDESWDQCQKVFPLRRGDCALAFAGAVYRFYPIYCQLVTYCNLHKKIYSRAITLRLLAGKIEEVTHYLLTRISDLPSGQTFADGAFEFLLCGWDFESGDSFCRIYSYDETTGKVSRRKVRLDIIRNHLNHPVFMIGDCVPEVM